MSKVQKPTCEIVTVTPKMAKEWITQNIERQRRVNKETVKAYEKEMRNGYWRLNGETIKFDSEGTMIDGQHRLHACIRANTAFETIVVNGLQNDTFETIDTGRNRTSGDILTIMGVKNASIVAAGIRLTIKYQNQNPDITFVEERWGKAAVDNHEVRGMYESDSEGWDNDCTQLISPSYQMAYRILAPAVGLFLFRMFKKIDPVNHAKFFVTMQTSVPSSTFENPQLICPVVAARDRIMTMKQEIGKQVHSAWWIQAKLNICFAAWNALVEGKGFVRFPKVENNKFPLIIDNPYIEPPKDLLTEPEKTTTA